MPMALFSFLYVFIVLLGSGSASSGMHDATSRFYRYTSHPAINAYDLLSGGAIQNHLTDELEQKYYGVKNIFLGHDPKTGITSYFRDISGVSPGKVTVQLGDGSHIDVEFVGGATQAAHVVAGSGVDSHGNRLPSRWDQISDGSRGRSYDFSGTGNPHDQADFERFVGYFGVKLTGHGRHVRCVTEGQRNITCHRRRS